MKIKTCFRAVAATFPFWQAENWTMSQGDWFSLDNRGFVTILESGLYMVYAQVMIRVVFN